MKLLRKLGKSVTTDRWEKYLAKVRKFKKQLMCKSLVFLKQCLLSKNVYL